MMELLTGISPWWWVALAILLAAAEMLTVTTVLISSAVAALATALWLWATPSLPGAGQIAIFGILSIVFTFLGRALVGRFGDGTTSGGTLNRRASTLIGREAIVTEFNPTGGQVTLDGVPWAARTRGGATPKPGDRVRIVATDGIIVEVQPAGAISPGS